jgi:hypothetical protein
VPLFDADGFGGAAFRPGAARVGVFALDVCVAIREEVLPFTCGRLTVDGEFERVDDGLSDVGGLFSFRTETGSFEFVTGWPTGECWVGPVSTSCTKNIDVFSFATSLRDRVCCFATAPSWVRDPSPWSGMSRYQLLGDGGSRSASEKLRLWLLEMRRLDSEVLLCRAPSMPCPRAMR